MRTIPLTQGFVTLVDDEDYESLNRFKWTLSNTGQGRLYATRTIKRNGKCKSIRMHREILGLRVGGCADHIDGDGLNNQRSNLRACSQRENARNSKLPKSNTSGFRGVTRCGDKWGAFIRKGDGIKMNLGKFDSAEIAAGVYDEYARKFHGAFARLNFPDSR